MPFQAAVGKRNFGTKKIHEETKRERERETMTQKWTHGQNKNNKTAVPFRGLKCVEMIIKCKNKKRERENDVVK